MAFLNLMSGKKHVKRHESTLVPLEDELGRFSRKRLSTRPLCHVGASSLGVDVVMPKDIPKSLSKFSLQIWTLPETNGKISSWSHGIVGRRWNFPFGGFCLFSGANLLLVSGRLIQNELIFSLSQFIKTDHPFFVVSSKHLPVRNCFFWGGPL